MQTDTLLIVVLLLTGVGFWLGRARALQVAATAGGIRHLHSLPRYYGALTAIGCLLPAAVLLSSWAAVQEKITTAKVMQQHAESFADVQGVERQFLIDKIKSMVDGQIVAGEITPALHAAANDYRRLQNQSRWYLLAGVLALISVCLVWYLRRITVVLEARNKVESTLKRLFFFCSSIAVFTTVGIVLSVLFESIRFFQTVSVFEFLFGTHWSPQIAIRADQAGASGAFGAIPLFLGTLLISGIAMLVAVPVGLMSAIYLAEYANTHVRAIGKPLLEVLAGIPTVVYGFFAALTLGPFLRDSGAVLGLSVSSESALAAGLVMGVMIIPFVSSLSDDVITAVPQSLRDGSYGLGATRSETIRKVVIPAALPGIIGGVLLAASRAIGETMIVVMAAGLAANLTANPLESVTTVTVQIVTLLVGDQEFDSPKTLAAFALGLVLFVVTLVLNVIALYVVRKYREQYE